jgi:hypothetical protein
MIGRGVRRERRAQNGGGRGGLLEPSLESVLFCRGLMKGQAIPRLSEVQRSEIILVKWYACGDGSEFARRFEALILRPSKQPYWAYLLQISISWPNYEHPFAPNSNSTAKFYASKCSVNKFCNMGARILHCMIIRSFCLPHIKTHDNLNMLSF